LSICRKKKYNMKKRESMMKQRLFSAILSFSVLGQMTAGMLPELPAAAAGQNSLSLSEFAAQVRETLKSDDKKTFYKEIVYDPAAGTLTQDGGAAQTEIGALSVRGGELLVDTGVPKRKGISVQAVDRYAQFDAAAEAMGYESEQRDGVQIITNEFQTARYSRDIPACKAGCSCCKSVRQDM
jgi:hypothetical protein